MSLTPRISRYGKGRGMVLAAATLGFAVIQLDVSVVNVAVKPIGAALGACSLALLNHTFPDPSRRAGRWVPGRPVAPPRWRPGR
jgi:hypothetical protein